MNDKYLDMHIHTSNSDGMYTPSELCKLCVQNGLSIISITDHNCTEDITALQRMYPELTIIPGAEISAVYTDESLEETEIHIVALGIDPKCPRLQEVLKKNQPDRAPYINAILDRLRCFGIDLGSYSTLCEQYPETKHIGRMHIAQLLCEKGYTDSVDEAFETYIGAHGKRLCYVNPPLRYVSMDDAVKAVLAAGGVPVLCHLYYYRLSESSNEQLVNEFSKLAKGKGAMEVIYARYSQEQRQSLAALAVKYGLMYSAASDYHGQDAAETLNNRFSCETCKPLLEALGL